MKKIIQNLKNGKTELIDIPKPNAGKNEVLIKTTHSLVSLGTERMLVDFAKSNLLNKALKQPEKVKIVLDKVKAEGILSTLSAVKNKLDEPMSLGYCNAGIVVEVGDNVNDLCIGDRVVSNGAHSEYVSVSKNLVQKIPDDVKNEDAVFTVISSVALQGMRLCNPTYGEKIVVIGLGLIGLITLQLLKANGCEVIGVDLDEKKCKIAKSYGISVINPSVKNLVKTINSKTNDVGVDGVIITAATNSNKVISDAANISRKKGRIVLVGVVGLNINRSDFYDKELSFQVSCSYGPGRYDEEYEVKGNDYPIGYVRWTEKRNFECILNSISNGNLNFSELVTDLISFENFNKIYDNMNSNESIASILKYKDQISESQTIELNDFTPTKNKAIVGLIGAGNFTKSTLLPILKDTNAKLKGIASFNGLNGTLLAKKYGFNYSTTDYKKILKDKDIDTIIITTRHNSHAQLVIESLKANKNVFVEKPLAINENELNNIIDLYKKVENPSLMVGFNRRFSPHIKSIKKSLGTTDPINIVATMNAGFIPKDHWVHDINIGGGRIIGEACHYMDLCNYLTGSKIKSVCMNAMGLTSSQDTDNASILLKFENGSNATINYFANGAKSYSKERIEVYHDKSTWITDNFISSFGYNTSNFKKLRTSLDKGHKAQFNDYIKYVTDKSTPLISINEIINTTKASFAALKSLKESKWIKIT